MPNFHHDAPLNLELSQVSQRMYNIVFLPWKARRGWGTTHLRCSDALKLLLVDVAPTESACTAFEVSVVEYFYNSVSCLKVAGLGALSSPAFEGQAQLGRVKSHQTLSLLPHGPNAVSLAAETTHSDFSL